MSTIINASGLSINGTTLADSSAITFPSSQRKTYTPTAVAATGIGSFMSANGSYIDIGALKIAFCRATATWSSSVAQSGTCTISLPSGLFTSILNVQITAHSVDPTVTQSVVLRGNTTSQISFIIYNTTGAAVTTGSAAIINVFVIGS